MGLDTVELVMEVENYFGIRIPDTVAEQIYTVQDIADAVCRLLGVGPAAGSSFIFGQALAAVQTALQELLGLATAPTVEAPLATILPPEADVWSLFLAQLARRTGWLCPALPAPAPPRSGWLARLFAQEPGRWPDWRRATLADLVGWMVALDYRQLYAGHAFRHPYDVQRAVIGIVSDKSGVDLWEIRPSDSMTNDLGMD